MMNIDFGKKPLKTRIQLTKSGYFFEAYIPPLRFDRILFFMVPFTICWDVVIWSCYIAFIVNFSGDIRPMLLSSPFLGISGLLTYFCLFTLFAKTYLRIDRHEISIIKTLFGQKVMGKRPQPKGEITKLIFTHEYAFRDDDDSPRIKPAALKIEIGKKSFQLGGYQGGIEHESELEWLAFEVSEWLDKPLTIIEVPVID
jgi:hypothetical protein